MGEENETLRSILERRSVRSFGKADVEAEKEELLAKAAMAAPSAGNLQSRYFYFVRDEGARGALKRAARGQQALEAPLVITVCADSASASSRYGRRGRELYSVQDAAASAENILIAATSLGLATCWVGAFDEEAVSEALEIPGNLRPVALIPVGYASGNPESPERKPADAPIKRI